MNKAGRIAAAINSQASHFQLRACLFHSTPVSERKRGTQWNFTSYGRNKMDTKIEADSELEMFLYASENIDNTAFNRHQRMLRKKNLFQGAEQFNEDSFQSWKPYREQKPEPPPRRRKPWYEADVRDNEPSRRRSRNRASQFRTRVEFCDADDDHDFDNIFRKMFGGNRSFYWSFTKDDDDDDEDEPRYWSSSSYSSNFRTSNGRNYHFEEEYEQEFNTSKEYARPVEGSRSDRLALGLSPSGPLKMNDVKNAYRACALKWHPDRHQGSSKVVAEEKFKVCSAAYQSLCDKLTIN